MIDQFLFDYLLKEVPAKDVSELLTSIGDLINSFEKRTVSYDGDLREYAKQESENIMEFASRQEPELMKEVLQEIINKNDNTHILVNYLNGDTTDLTNRRWKEAKNHLNNYLRGKIHSINKSEIETKHTRQTKTQPLAAPAIRLFCAIVHQSGIITRGFDESAQTYCKKVCKRFSLTYSDNVRKYFTHEAEIKERDKNFKKVVELILPKLQADAKQRIGTFLNNKTKMYT